MKTCHFAIETQSSLRVWVQAVRPFAFTASMTPVFLGAALALRSEQAVRWELFPLVVLASLLIHAGTNLVSDYFDFRKGVDRPETYGSSRVLVDGLLRPGAVLLAGLAAFAATAAIGLVFIAIHGWPILILGLIGMAGGFFYTALPVAYKYIGLGDLCVFWLMGPLMTVGAFLVLTGLWSWQAMAIALPVGCLVAAILSGNNLRDIADDSVAAIRTTAGLLGHRAARWEYAALVISAYILVVILIAMDLLPVWSLLTFLSLPPAMRNIRIALRSDPTTAHTLAALDVQSAQVHLLFGVLLIASVVLGVVG
ncbi:MAG TPA: 1,4-dihydroxy-2-naphthoate octaprenyltransferase [Phycisphaerales bacterium]|nr:1,4-dihydroxy-2-naphthoate octaprenyltransferase [Phycisphaerales bacterium]